jgi:hypothetical protein
MNFLDAKRNLNPLGQNIFEFELGLVLGFLNILVPVATNTMRLLVVSYL